jgi:hypothetical protein
LPLRAAAQLARDSSHGDSDDIRWTQWQESVVSTTVGSCQGSIRWASIQPILATLRTQLAVFNTARRRVYRRHPPAHQRNWQPPMQRASPRGLQPVPSRLSQPGHSIRPAILFADFTRSTGLTALSQRAEPEGDTDSLADSSVADTEASQASTLLVCLLLACQASTLSSPATDGILAGRSTSPLSRAPHLGFGHPDAHSGTPATSMPHSQRGWMCIPTKAPGFAPRLHGWHRILALTGTVTLLTPGTRRLEWCQSSSHS